MKIQVIDKLLPASTNNAANPPGVDVMAAAATVQFLKQEAGVCPRSPGTATGGSVSVGVMMPAATTVPKQEEFLAAAERAATMEESDDRRMTCDYNNN